jgi:hypothetical protein
LACLLCLFETRAEYTDNVLDLRLKLLHFCDGEVWVLGAAADAVELVVYGSEGSLRGAEGAVVPVPFADSGADLEGLGPVGVVDVKFIWSDTDNWT